EPERELTHVARALVAVEQVVEAVLRLTRRPDDAAGLESEVQALVGGAQIERWGVDPQRAGYRVADRGGEAFPVRQVAATLTGDHPDPPDAEPEIGAGPLEPHPVGGAHAPGQRLDRRRHAAVVERAHPVEELLELRGAHAGELRHRWRGIA